ncbi:MAG: acetyl-CoA carboxyl transferase [Candidatus Nanopelagicales bacterium]|nr:acetyl-CoA carboxyl transferase [Candidatus Nanopelagicales bacterium]
MSRISALEALLTIADADSLHLWPGLSGDSLGISGAYAAELAAAAASSGCDESVLAAELRIGGVPTAGLAWEFGFLGGSVGVRTAARIVATIRRATAEGLPLVALPRSGGTRMQEGAPAFIQMVAIAAALAEHRDAGLPYLVHLCSPTTGGVLATLGSAGDLTSAEPGAMVGFLGPRAFAAITGGTFPEGIQVAEHLLACGVIDAVLDWPEVRERWATLLGLWAGRARAAGTTRDGGAVEGVPPGPVVGAPASAAELWRYVEASRAHDRIDAAQFIAAHMTDVVTLPGTATGEVGHGALVALGRLEGMPLVVAATEDRWTGEPLTVDGLRTIRRGIALAGRWGLPVLTIVDTLGAQLSVEGEESGIAGEISRVMLDLVHTPAPTAALLLGAGTGGAALALLASDRIVAASHAWVSPLAPEGAAAIRHGGTHDPAQIAWEQQIGAHALAGHGFVDVIVRESEPDWVATAAHQVVASLREVLAGSDPRRRMERFAAWTTEPTPG